MLSSCTSPKRAGIGEGFQEFSWPTSEISSTASHVPHWAHGDKIATSSNFEYIRPCLHASCCGTKYNKCRLLDRERGRQTLPADNVRQREGSLHKGLEGLCGSWRSFRLCNHALFAGRGFVHHLRHLAQREVSGSSRSKGFGILRADTRTLQGQKRWPLRDRSLQIIHASIPQGWHMTPALRFRRCREWGGRRWVLPTLCALQ